VAAADIYTNLCTMNLELIEQAFSVIRNKVLRTPIEYSRLLSELLGSSVYIKYESMQITGSFKVRGALFYLSTLTSADKKAGVAACSAGNHGLGVAYASKEAGVPCTAYVPKNVDQAKKKKIESLGARVICSQFNGYDDTLQWAQEEVKKNGLHLISAFDDARIMAGNGGTLGVEILEDMPDVETVIFPVGGGGMGAGLSYYMKSKAPETHLIACQHIDSPALQLSLEKGYPMTSLPAIETLASGVEGGIGARCFYILQDRVDSVALVTEAEIEAGVRWMLANHQFLIEPTAAVTIAGCLSKKVSPRGKTVVILSGRNVAYHTLQKLCSAQS